MPSSNLEDILVDGQQVRTLRELLRPGLTAVFVGLNPSPVRLQLGIIIKASLGGSFGRGCKNIRSPPNCHAGMRISRHFRKGSDLPIWCVDRHRARIP